MWKSKKGLFSQVKKEWGGRPAIPFPSIKYKYNIYIRDADTIIGYQSGQGVYVYIYIYWLVCMRYSHRPRRNTNTHIHRVCMNGTFERMMLVADANKK